MHQTPLNAFHRERNARLVDFAGWEMPVVYTSIIEEHHFTRQHCTMFDVSHMGRIEVWGAGDEAFLQKLCTRNVGDMAAGLSRYSHICREDGGILDDVIVSRCEDHYLIVCNASNRTKIVGWLGQHGNEFGVEIRDRTLETAMVAVQGPEALETLGQLLPVGLDDLKRYRFKTGNIMGVEFFIARSGYTGEDGVEIILPAQFATTATQMLISKSGGLGRPIKPAGLGARDTLRFEAGMPLYGHELTEEWDSITAGQGWAVDLSKDFIGQSAMKRVADEGPRRTIVGLELDGKRIARDGCEVYHDGRRAGFITSGTKSPTFDKVIAMGMLETTASEPGTQVEIDLRGQRSSATVVALPFYKRPKK
ncbi:MAG: glycine cleavage system aminomethyltransferase GcvT [Planctomycetes bacterium]|nr:glycine cleavage system aminomethyltransferase GcvT [Planctomycetota bacterium]